MHDLSQFNRKSGENDGKITEIKTLEEDTIHLNISELSSSSSVIVWSSTHTIRDRTHFCLSHQNMLILQILSL